MPTTTEKTVRELALENPSATRIFERLHIDYCCGGGKSLSDACLHAHVSVDDVVRALEQGSSFSRATETNLPDFAKGELGNLIEHIVTTHHAYVKQELPRLHQLLAKVVSVPWPSRRARCYLTMRPEIPCPGPWAASGRWCARSAVVIRHQS